jgi:hypothetical protein
MIQTHIRIVQARVSGKRFLEWKKRFETNLKNAKKQKAGLICRNIKSMK